MNQDAIDLVQLEMSGGVFKYFVRQFWPVVSGDTFVPGYHIDAICEHLQAVRDNQIKRLLINIPIRHGKSILTSVMYPAWLWIDDPANRIISATYSKELTERDSLRTRRLILSDKYQSRFSGRFRMSEDLNRRDYYTNDKNGHRFATSINSATSGFDCDTLIVDDLHDYRTRKSRAEVEAASDYYLTTLSSRLVVGKDKIILAGHRVAESDIYGHIADTDQNCGEWTYLILPAEARPAYSNGFYNALGWKDTRQEGELLAPQRISPEYYASEKKKLRQDWWPQYQQDVSGIEGDFFKADWFKTYKVVGGNYHCGDKVYSPKNCVRFGTVDLAISQKAAADNTVAQIWDVVNGDMILVHQTATKRDGTKLIPTLVSVFETYQPDFLAVEKEGFQGMVVDQLREANVTVKVVTTQSRDKEARSIPAQVKAEAGQVWLPVTGAEELVHECTVFPNGRHDDRADCLFYACELAAKFTGRQDVEPTEDEMNRHREEQRRQDFLKMLNAGL